MDSVPEARVSRLKVPSRTHVTVSYFELELKSPRQCDRGYGARRSTACVIRLISLEYSTDPETLRIDSFIARQREDFNELLLQ